MHERRKLDHIRICLEENVQAPRVTTGLERFHFEPRALPEIDKESIDLSVNFLGKALKAPIIISSMTGGTDLAAKINRNLASAAQSFGIAMAVGSQRPAIENGKLAYTYQVRDVAPKILLFANLGAVQLNFGYSVKQCRQAIEMIDADALILHLNSLQECIQARGNTDFKGLLAKIGEVCAGLSVPVVVKEVGCGISDEVALALKNVGVACIDVAGAGGTSWALVEKYRAEDETTRRIADTFASWGIPTARAIETVRRRLPDVPIVGSGGIRSGLDAAKALALGADVVGLAMPMLRPAMESAEAVCDSLKQLLEEMRIAMFCVGASNVKDLKKAKLYRI